LNDSKDRISLTIQEGVDGVTTDGMTYTSSAFARTISGVKGKIFASLKEKILADRSKQTKEDQLETLVDLTNFETFLNS
jgi:hypothetical protein